MSEPTDRFIVVVNPNGKAFAFGDAVPLGRTRLARNEAIKLATRMRLLRETGIVQIIDAETGKALNVERFEENPQVVLITHDAANGCGIDPTQPI